MFYIFELCIFNNILHRYNIQTKNYLAIGDKNNTNWKGVITKRKFGNTTYDSLFGSGNIETDPATSIELKQGQSTLGRYDLRKNGYLYNFLSNMPVAEITSFAETSDSFGAKGYCLLNSGNDMADPILIQWGKISITPTAANTLTKAQANFLYQFKGNPMVVTEIITNDVLTASANAYDITQNGFVVNLKRSNIVTTHIMWVAIGNGTNALPE